MKKICMIYVFILISSFAIAQEGELITTNISIINESDFLGFYLDNSYHDKMAVENLIVADQKIDIAFQPYSGSFFMEGGFAYGNTTNPSPIHNILINDDIFSTDLLIDYTNFDVSVGLDATIYPSGTYVKVQGGVRGLDASSQTIDIKQNPTGGLGGLENTRFREKSLTPFFDITLVQPFLKNGFAYNMHSRIIKIARNNKDLGYIAEHIKLESVVFDALIKYHKLILDTKIISVREESLREIQDVHATQRQLAQVGARSTFDVTQLSVKIDEITVGLEEAKKQLELDFQILEERLNIPLDRENLNFLDYSILLDKEFSAESVYDDTLQNSWDLTKLNILLQNAEHAIAIAKNQLLPEMNLLFSYENATATYEDHPTLNRNIDIFKATQDNIYVGLQFKMPLAYISEKAKVREAYAQAKNVEYNRENLETELKFITKEKFLKWSNDTARLEAQENIMQSHRNISIEAVQRYRNSEMSILDFFDYEENYRQSQIKFALDQFNQKVSLLTLELVQGTLLNTYNIKIESVS